MKMGLTGRTMGWLARLWRSRIARAVGTVSLALLVAVLVESDSNEPFIGGVPGQGGDSYIAMKILEFDHSISRLEGEVEIVLTNQASDLPDRLYLLFLAEGSFQPSMWDDVTGAFRPPSVIRDAYDDADRLMSVGGSVDGSIGSLIPGPSALGGIRARSPFLLAVREERQAFWYPFDSYEFALRPEIISFREGQRSELTEYFSYSVDFRGQPLWIVEDSRELVAGSYEVRGTIRRPLTLQVLAAITFLLTFLWLIWLAKGAKLEGHAAQLIGFVVTVWGWRSILGGGVAFPSFADYLVLVLIVFAVAIVLVRWFEAPRGSEKTDCPHCLSLIPKAAAACSQCGRNVRISDNSLTASQEPD